MTEFRMPSLGADMEAGTIVEWLVKPGDRVKRGDVVAVVATEKADIEVEVFTAGVVDQIIVPEGQKVPVGTVLATVTEEARIPAQAAAPAAAIVRVEPRTGGPSVPSPLARKLARDREIDLSAVRGTGTGGAITRRDVERAVAAAGVPGPVAPPARRLRVSPFARKRASEMGIELAIVQGTGPGGAVTEADVERAAGARPAPVEAGPAKAAKAARAAVAERQPSPPAPVPIRRPAVSAERLAAMQEATGALMARSKREIPHYYLATTIDVTEATAWVEAANLTRPVAQRLLPSVLLLKAVALAIREVPEMNGFHVDGSFRPSGAVHLGVAISVRGGGLIAPAIHDADAKTLDELMAALRDLVQRARVMRLRGSEMSDATITVTNLGDQGVEEVFGVIYPPQVALVGFGRVLERPWAADGMVGARRTIRATLSGDHRVSDGHRGGLFLSVIDRLLRRPEEL